jgi:SAM-dependent methyltransferase
MTEVLNKYDIALHNQIHAAMLSQDPNSLLNNPRLQILEQLNDLIDVNGVVADIGCGSGYFGIGVANTFQSVTRVDCIEASKLAVEDVIPRNIAHFNLANRVRAVHGSFDALPSHEYDIVFAMGALHHTRNLRVTLESIFQSLKPNGILVAQEPAMPDSTSHNDYKTKYNIQEERFGLKIRNGDRYDRFFRECEYKCALVLSGFDILLWKDCKLSGKPRNSKIKTLVEYVRVHGLSYTLKKIKMKILRKRASSETSPEADWKKAMRKATSNVKPKLLVARKADCEEIFHDK